MSDEKSDAADDRNVESFCNINFCGENWKLLNFMTAPKKDFADFIAKIINKIDD